MFRLYSLVNIFKYLQSTSRICIKLTSIVSDDESRILFRESTFPLAREKKKHLSNLSAVLEPATGSDLLRQFLDLNPAVSFILFPLIRTIIGSFILNKTPIFDGHYS